MSLPPRSGTWSLALLGGLALGCSQEVKIGAIISESGAVAEYGRQVRRGIDLALEEINAGGGFKGKPIQLVVRDDASSPERGVEAVRELAEEQGVRLMIGAVSSPVTLAIAPICQEKEILLLSPASSAPSITEAGGFVLRNYPSDVLEGTAMADFARTHGVRRVAIFALANEFGQGHKAVFTKGFESEVRHVVASYDIPLADPAADAAAERERHATALQPMIDEVKTLDVQGIYIVGYVHEMVTLLARLHEAGITALLLGTSSVTDDVARQAGAAAENLVFPRPSFDVGSAEPAVAAFVREFRAKYDEDPDIFAAHGYDALKLIWRAMTDADGTYSDDVRDALLGLKDYVGAAGRTTFDERGDVVRYPQLFVVRGGVALPLEQFEQEGGELPIPGGS